MPLVPKSKTMISPGAQSARQSITVIYACSAAGGLIAAIADLVQKEDASAIVKMTSTSAKFLQITLAPIWILAFIVAIALVLCFVLQPESRKNSFVVGMGVIACLMTITPYRAPATGLPTKPLESAVFKDFGVEGARPVLAQYVPPSGAGVDTPILWVRVHYSVPLVAQISVSVFNPSTLGSYEQRNSAYYKGTVEFPFQIRGASIGQIVEYRIDVNGERSFNGAITLKSSTTYIDKTIDLTRDERADLPGQDSIIKKLQKNIFTPFKW